MRVLDLDLDFFLADVCELAEYGKRPELNGHEPWSANEMRAFLEGACGLSKVHMIPGAVFETHDGALSFWNSHMLAGELTVPFHVTHVDAHSDLGIGYPGPAFVLESILTRPPDARADIASFYESRQLDEANYLLFALAFRWISSLENVRNPNSRADMPAFCHDGFIQLESTVGRLIPALNHHEPRVPFRVYPDWQKFHADVPFDFATLAISPRYAPKEADMLVDVFREYILSNP